MFVKNAIVKMNWDVEGFIETKAGGFVAAIHEYDTAKGKVAVVFMNKLAFLVYDSDEERPATMDEIKVALKQCYDNDLDFVSEMEEQDAAVILNDLSEKNEVAQGIYGFSDEDMDDMENRIWDVSAYEEEVTIDM